jgi:hypothetical protein
MRDKKNKIEILSISNDIEDRVFAPTSPKAASCKKGAVYSTVQATKLML